MNKVLMAVIAAMWAILFAVGGWWCFRAEGYFKIVEQLHWRDYYLNGDIKAVPLDKPTGTPPIASPAPK